jgi:tetratricopeptide (TPR) repeat protein
VTKLTINQVLQRGVDAHKAGQLQEAHRLYAAILKVQPKHPDANHNTGLLTVGFGKTEQALPFFKTALEANPSMAQFWYSHIVALIKLERLIDAKVLLNQAKSKGIRGPDFDQLEQKLNDANKALSIKPDHAEAYHNMGNLLQEQNKLEDAIEAYNKAIAIKPDYANAYYNMGIALQKQSKMEDAIEAYNKAIAIKPDYVEAYYIMGIVLQEQSKLEEAVEAYSKAIAIKPDYVEAYYNMGNARQEQNKPEKAIEAYNKAIAIKPDYAEAYYNMGNALQEQNKLEEAIEAYNKVIALKPDYANAYKNMGTALRNQGKLKEAVEAYNKTLSIKPDYAEAYNNIGNALIDRGKLKEAIEAYNKALDIKPDYADAIENLLNLLTQVQGTVLNSSKKFNQITANKQLEMFQRPKSHILHAISSFLSADEKQVQKHVHNFNTCAPKLLDNLTSKDKVFCFAYSEYLSALLKKPLVRTLNLSAVNVVYHIGESHCLSYAHHIIEINGATSRIVPMIAFGAKAFHFSNVNDSAFKAITKANLNSIPKSSQVFVSFGEIDCRPNEGFISAATKLDQSVEDIIANTLTGYLQWFAKYNQDWNHNMYFVNVPAPVYDHSYNAKKNADVANVVALFNQQMKKQIAQYKFKMIDVFGFTLGKDGFSNNRFHIDGKHLGAKAIPKIEQQLNS